VDQPAPSRRQSRRPRLAAFDYTGRHVYHLVTVTRGRAAILHGGNALAVMPDHAHMLVLGADDAASATKFVQRFKQLSGVALRAQGRPFWQQSFFDHVVRPGEGVLSIARYILANPLRAGLVQPDSEWLYQGGTLLDGASRDGAKASSLRPDEELRGDAAGAARCDGRDGAKAASLRPNGSGNPARDEPLTPHKQVTRHD
jgi:REP element-mobilizing transposase RayT